MSMRRRNGSAVWYIDIRTPGGGRIRQTAGTTDKKEAQDLHDKLKHEAWRITKLGEKPRRTFDEAALRYLRSRSAKRTTKRRYGTSSTFGAYFKTVGSTRSHETKFSLRFQKKPRRRAHTSP
jgi:hypothetical protein